MRERQLIRQAIMLQLEAASPATLPTETLLQGVCLAGHKITEKQLQKELAYLNDKKLVESALHELDSSDRRHRLTAAGQDYLEADGLI